MDRKERKGKDKRAIVFFFFLKKITFIHNLRHGAREYSNMHVKEDNVDCAFAISFSVI